MSKLDTNYIINLDLIKDRANSVMKFGLVDVETSDFYLMLYNNGTRIFDKNYIVTLCIVKPNGNFKNIELEPKESLKRYYCNLPDTLKNIPGEYVCQVLIFDNLTGEKKISKSKFKYSVDLDLASEMAGIIDEEEQESILTNILNRLLTLENPVEPYATQKHVDECVSTLTEEIDTIKVKDVDQDGRLVNIESKNTEQDERLDAVESKNVNQDNRLDIIEAKDIEQDNRLVNIETRNTEQDNRLNTIESKDIEQDGRLNTLENKVDGIDEKIVDTIEPTLANHGNRVDTLENKDLVHESRMTDIESKNVEQDNRLTSVEGINTTQDNRLDALEVKDIAHESRMVNIETKNTEQDNRLNSLESKDLIHESRMTDIKSKNIEQDERLSNIESKNTEQDNRLGVAENRLANIGNDITNTMQPIIDGHTSRLDAIEAINVAQNTRLDAIEVKNQQQDDRLLDIEKVNSRQGIDIKCLYGASQTIDVTKEGNSIYLQNSNNGFTIVDEIKGNTLVNCNKEPNKEIILNGNINTQGYSNVTLTEGVDGGLVDVALEGNTMVNICDQKDPVAITKSYTVETGNHVALQGEYDGKCRPVVSGNTLVNLAYKPHLLSQVQHIDNKYVCSSTVNPDNSGIQWKDKSLFKLNTTYTIIMTVENTCSEAITFISGFDMSGRGWISADTVNANSTKIIKFKKTYTTDIPNYNAINFAVQESGLSFAINDAILILEGDYTNKPIPECFEGLQSSFEDKVVTQEMVDTGEELAENLGKYKVNYVISREDGTVGFTKTFYLNSPLLEGDTIEQQRDNVVHVHRSEIRAYQTDDELTLPTDITNTLVSKVTPQYEVISQNDTILCDSYVNGHLDVDSVVPIEKVDFLHFEKDLTYLYANTQYAVQFTSDKAVTSDITLGGTKLLAQSIVVGLNKIVITTPKTLVNNKLIIDGVGTNISNIVVTEATDQDFGYFEGMKSVGECEDLEVVSSNSDGTLSNTQTLAHEPLRAAGDIKDKYVLIDGKWYIERNCGYRNNYSICDAWSNENLTNRGLKLFKLDNSIEEFDDMNALRKVKSNKFKCVQYGYMDGRFNVPFLAYITENGNLWVSADINYTQQDMLNYIKDCQFVYELPSPQYEPIDYNPLEVYSGTTHITTNSTIPTNITVKNHGYNCLLKPSTTYTVSSNLGLNTVTTPSTLSEDCLRFYDTDTSTVTTMKNVTVLEGDYTTNGKPIPSHFSGIESAFEQEYDEAVGKYKVKIRVQNEDATKENYIEFYIQEPLRGIGDSKDKVFIQGDKVIVERKCGGYTFDGSDDEEWYKYDYSSWERVTGFIVNCMPEGWYARRCVTNLFRSLVSSLGIDSEGFSNLDNGSHICIKIDKFKLQTQSTAGFRQWLQQNPVTIVYQLAEPVYEEVEYNDVKLFIESFKNSTLFYNSNIPVTSKVHYSYSVPIVDTVAQTANISDQQDSMIIDLATQCAVMEIMLM